MRAERTLPIHTMNHVVTQSPAAPRELEVTGSFQITTLHSLPVLSLFTLHFALQWVPSSKHGIPHDYTLSHILTSHIILYGKKSINFSQDTL